MKLSHDQSAPGMPDVRGDGRGSPRPDLQGEGPPEGRPTLASRFREQPLLNSVLVLGCLALIILALVAVGPASQSSGQSTRTTTVKNGVVQSTVSGSGNIQSANQLNLGFKTSGTVSHIYVKEGQHVTAGQLLATLDPGSAEVALEQAKATLQSAEANLAKEEENEGESSSGGGSSGSGATAAAASTSTIAYTANADAHPSAGARTAAASAPASKAPTSTAPASTTPTSTTKSSTSPSAGTQAGGSTRAAKGTESNSSTTPASSQGASSSSTKQSAATREANLASARAAVKSDKLAVQSAEQAVQNTKLYAPTSGTIVTLSGEVGETVSGTGTTKAAASTGSSSSGGSSTGGAGGVKSSAGGSSSAAASSSSGQGSSSGSSAFAVLSDLESLQLVVALSESEIGSVKEGQIATVTIEALNGRKVAAHVVSVSQVPTSSSGAVSYDVTFQLDQPAEGLKVGMSATAEVVVKQAEGLNVPTTAIKAGSVTVVRSGKHVTQPVTTGLAGNSSTIILSGLKASEEVVLPSATTTGAASSLGSRGSSRTGSRGGLGGGAFPGGGFPGGPPGG